MNALARCGLLAVALAGVTRPLETSVAAAPGLVSRDVYLMGTRAVLSTWDTDRAAALARLERLLAPLESTEAQLSTWRPESEISRINAASGQPVRLSAHLCALMEELEYWIKDSGGAFDPAIGALTGAWAIHGLGRIPGASLLETARRRSGWTRAAFDRRRCTLALPAGASLDVGGFGKGEALDRARRALGPAARPWMIDLGGQIATHGVPPGSAAWQVDLAHPLRRTEPVRTIALTGGSLATTAGSERDLRVGSTRIGHVLDPRTGRPAAFAGSVVIWHDRALVADVLSTALFVMGPERGIRWADDRDIAGCYLVVGADGRVTTRPSRAFAVRYFSDP